MRTLAMCLLMSGVVHAEPSPVPLPDEDFLLTSASGEWRPHPETADVRVRRFGPVALVHGFLEPGVRTTDVFRWDGAAWRVISQQRTPLKAGVAREQRRGTAPPHAPWRGTDPTGDDDAVLRQLNESYVRAFRESDVAWYDAHLAPDYEVVYGDGSHHDRAAALADFAQPTFQTHLRSFPVDQVRIRRFGDVALIHAENAYETRDGRKGINRYTDVWVRRDGRWQCVAAHITVHQPPR